ncbi:DNA topoisomerase III [Lachnospiraceae bacterium WCA-9-b2]|uniref:DNA topoisomerase n=1 Tax=Sporofaciens musculi TaxID=2681861 RepID=A0A7X3SH64_9FIRM|nr:DNA topoisomerase 3 [Sporofaciens musculi]MXP74053.1 DNA topoisomerase III [Sporofaciens musculi]
MFLVIAEKPSVSQSLARILSAGEREDGYLFGKDCIVSWCLGHLAEYVSPEHYDSKYEKWEFADLPIVPEQWELSVAKDKKKQFAVLKKLLNRSDLDYVVNACDAGREGELIFKRVYDLSGSKIPVKRLWISSMEDSAIREGFANLKDGKEYENLCEASVCRAKADWLIGMNATRAFTTKYYKRLTVGRVQTPTLAMLVERQDAIDRFVKEAYYKVAVEGDGIRAVSESIKDEAEGIALAEKCNGKSAVIRKVEKIQKKNQPPKLYDLTTLQREANRFFGYTAQETLRELQELYEAKLVTYPRTDSQYITADMEQTALELLDLLPELLPFLQEESIGKNVRHIINNGKVSDHHALLPTKEALEQDFEEVSERQRNIFRLIGQRLAQAVSEECIYEETAVTVLCGGHEFSAKGKAIVQPGFKRIEDVFRNAVQKGKQVEKNSTDDTATIPEGLQEGMGIAEVRAGNNRHYSSPPKPYSEDTLLAAMERAGNQDFDEDTEKKGLGTPATRAAILEKLVSSGYAKRSGKQILPTADGKELIAVLPDYLKSAAMTAEWENKLLLMEKGKMDSSEFLQEITDLIDTMIAGCSAISGEEQSRFHQRESVGTCPVCGNPVYEGKKNFYCNNRECSFCLWKENRYVSSMKKLVDKKMVMDLLAEGRTHVKDLYSQKTGKTFAADLLMKAEDGRANFSLEFPKNKGNAKSGRNTGRNKK